MECDFAKIVIDRITPYFHTFPEQWSKCGKNRIDFILIEKTTRHAFGIEFKDANHKTGNDLGEHILQSMRYAASSFNVNGEWQKLPILMCPPISYAYLQCPVQESKKIMPSAFTENMVREYFHDRHDKHHEHHTINGMLGALSIGEIRSTKGRNYTTGKEVQYLYFSFSNKPLWEEKMDFNTRKPKGIHVKNYEFQINKPLTYRFV